MPINLNSYFLASLLSVSFELSLYSIDQLLVISFINHYNDTQCSAPINSRPNVVVRSPTPFGLGRNGCRPSRGSQLPRALPFIFSLCCPLNDRRRAAHSIYKIGRLVSLFLFSCSTLALLRLLILLLLLMSGKSLLS